MQVEIDGVLNARSFGESPWLLRTAALDALTATGAEQLRRLGVGTVLDLREESERGTTTPLPTRSLPLYSPDGPPLRGSIHTVYAGLLRERGPAIARAVAAIADAEGAALVHCSAGKDRTGLVVALALLVAGHDVEEVVADYALSGALIAPSRRPQLAHLEPLDAESLELHLDSPAAAMRAALAIVDEFGGPHAYLLKHGVTPEQLAALADKGAG